jgi:hypothetical protein
MSPDHRHPPEVERRIREAALDGTIEESFPASDPPSTIPNPDLDEVLEEKGEAGINPQLPIPNPQATLSYLELGVVELVVDHRGRNISGWLSGRRSGC